MTSAEDSVDARPIIQQFLADHHQFHLAPYQRYIYRYQQHEVVSHLFRVAASLDSLIVGEPQILGQLKRAYALGARRRAERQP